jgi:hypothetical protein
LFSDYLLNDWWWLAWVGLWVVYSKKTTICTHILSCSHRHAVNPIPIGSTSSFGSQPQLRIIFQMGRSVLFVFRTFAGVTCFLQKKKGQISKSK